MKILHIIPSYYPAFRFGGPIQSVHLINKTLVKKGINIDVLTTNAGLSKEQSAMRKEKWMNVDGVRVKYVNFIGYEHFNFSLSFALELKKIIKGYDLVHITAIWNFPVLAAAFISLLYHKPYIISPRGALYDQAIEFKSSVYKKIYYFLFAKYFIKKASAIHFTTENEQEKVIEYLNLITRSFVIPNGLDLIEIQKTHPKEIIHKFGLDERKKYLLILGRIDKIKGFNLLIPAFADILKKHNNLFLVIAGDDSTPYAAEVRKMLEEKNIGDKVIFTGQVAGDIKWALYKNAFLFVLPSYSENFGMSVVEAMACGIPIIISNKVGLATVIKKEDAGLICSLDEHSILSGINNLLNDAILRRAIVENALKLVQNEFEINKVAESFMTRYQKIINNKDK